MKGSRSRLDTSPHVKSKEKEMGDDRNPLAKEISGFICPLKYTNKLIDPPFALKLLPCPFVQTDRFIEYRETVLEQRYQTEVHADPFVGVKIDLIDPQTYALPGPDVELHPTDAKLLESDTLGPLDSNRSFQHARVVPWMRKTEYISSEFNRLGKGAANRQETRVGVKIESKVKEEILYRDLSSKIGSIMKTFKDVKQKVTKHYKKEGVTAVAEMPLLPDFEHWKYHFSLVRFDSDPCPGNCEEIAVRKLMVSQAQIRGMQDSNGEQFVSYFCPKIETMYKRLEDKEEDILFDPKYTYLHRQIRDYNWTINQGAHFQNNFFFVLRDDGVYYNELAAGVKLTKRKTTSQRGSLLALRYTEPTDEEIQHMNKRLGQLYHKMKQGGDESPDEATDRSETPDGKRDMEDTDDEEETTQSAVSLTPESKSGKTTDEEETEAASNDACNPLKAIKKEAESESDYDD